MNHKRLTSCLLAMLIAGMYGCDEGKYNDLKCNSDEDKPVCLDARYMMSCDPATQTLHTTSCDKGYVCSMTTGNALCVKDPKAKPDCTEGAKQCHGNTVQTCKDGTWSDAENPCENGCENGICKTIEPCTDKTTRCSEDGTAVQICTDGKWGESIEFCENGCENGTCKTNEPCTEEATQCSEDGTTVQTCTDGLWVDAAAPCPNGCENGICKTIELCTEDAKQCSEDGTTIQTCTDGTWVDTMETCKYGCENGECKPEPCTDEAMQCSEDGVYVQICEEGNWVNDTDPCEFGCEDGACKEAPCTEEETQCSEDGNTVQTCTGGFWVDASTPCEYGCDEGVCKPEPQCLEENAVQCAGDTVQTCLDGQWSDAETPCEFGCHEGVCKPEPQCLEENAVQCAGDTVQTCLDGQWSDAETPCEFGCHEGVCKPEPQCLEENAVQCAGDTVQTCLDGQWSDAETPCEFGCHEGVCKPEPQCLEENAVQCAGDTVQTCLDGQWSDAETPCEFGCHEGVCFESACGNLRLDEGEACDGELLGEKTCNDLKPMSTGDLSCSEDCKIIDSACELPAEGSDCDPNTFIQSCDGTKQILCSFHKVVNGLVDCAELYGNDCVVFGEGTNAMPECIDKAAEVCTTPNEESYRCSGTADLPNSEYYICTEAADGNLYNRFQNFTRCEGDTPSCLNSTHQCGRLTDDQGSSCSDTFEARCDAGEIAVTCQDEVVTATECDAGLKCIIDDNVPICLEPCASEGDTQYTCRAGSYSHEFVCTSKGEGLYYLDSDNEEYCMHGCETADHTCKLLSESEGKECNPESDKPTCEGTDVLLMCNEYMTPAVFAADSCSDVFGTNNVCIAGECVLTCDTVDDILYDCDDTHVEYGIPAASHKYICTQSGDVKGWVEDISAYKECESNQCATDGTCKPVE